MEQKASICRMVVYHHPGSADGKYPPMESPAVVQNVYADNSCDLCVLGNSNGIFFAKKISFGEGPSQWSWPKRV